MPTHTGLADDRVPDHFDRTRNPYQHFNNTKIMAARDVLTPSKLTPGPSNASFQEYRDPLNESISSVVSDETDMDEQLEQVEHIPANPVDLPAQVHHVLEQKNMEAVVKQFENISLSTSYIPSNEQLSTIRKLEVNDNIQQHETLENLKKIIDFIVQKDENGIKNFKEQLEKQSQQSLKVGQIKKSHIEKAEKVADKYNTSLKKPTFTEPPAEYALTPQRTSPREIISVTGKFNPSTEKADFTQIWNKLTAFGQVHYYGENEYKTALGYILEGDAYEAFANMMDDNKPLSYIIDYFAKVYGRKRSLIKDRQAVDNFVRLKNEPLDICMHRSLIAIDRLQHLYSSDAWLEMRTSLRRNILMQIISDDTKRHVQLEENEIIEKTGFGVEIDKLIDMAKKYEIFHNKVPTKDVSVAFQVASGGFNCNPEHIKLENQALKKKDFADKQNITELVHEILNSYPTRLYKNDQRSENQREQRKNSLRRDQRERRHSSFDSNRGLDDKKDNTPTKISFRPPTNPQLPPSIVRRRESISADRNRPFSPSQTRPDSRRYTPPRMPYQRPQSRGYSPNQRSGSYNRPYQQQQNDRNYRPDYRSDYRSPYRPRSNSGNRTSNYRANSRDRYPNRRDSQPRQYQQQRYRSPSPRRTTYSDNRGRSPYRRNSEVVVHSQNIPIDDRNRNRQRTPSFEKSVMVHINHTDLRN